MHRLALRRRDPGGRSRTRRRRLALAAGAAAALLAVPAAVATATPGTPSTGGAATGDASAGDAPSPAGAPRALAAEQLDITMQAQELSNWCWAAGGNTIAAYLGKNYDQNAFCNAALGRAQGSSCPNDQATLGNVQTALDWMGINPGSYVSGRLDYGTVRQEVSADRPVETRIQWSAGGGHMHVLYGYDTSQNWIYWGDPWPSNSRYNWASHAWYLDNNEFSWTHSLYGIGA